MRLVREAAPDDARFTIDGGNSLKHVIRQLDTTASNTYINNANFGTVGSAFPLAPGAGLAVEDPLVYPVGDGGTALNVQELETAAREGIPVTVIVFNDYGTGNVRFHQKYVYEERYAGVDLGGQDFATIAEEFGVAGRHVSTPREASDAIEEAIATDERSSSRGNRRWRRTASVLPRRRLASQDGMKTRGDRPLPRPYNWPWDDTPPWTETHWRKN